MAPAEEQVRPLRAGWTGRRVLVTGGAGNLGSHLTEWLVAAGARVTVADNLGTGRREHLAAVAERVDLRIGDLGAAAFAAECCAGQETVLHLAGVAPGLQAGPVDHEALRRANVDLGRTVISAAADAGVARLQLVSSSCVYPDAVPVPTPELPLAGTGPEHANRGYGEAKRELEALATAAGIRAGMTVGIVRLFNLYGPRDLRAGPGSHVVPSLLARILGPEPVLTIWGSGRQTRALRHARDAAWVLAWLADRAPAAAPVNVGSAEEVSMRELAERLFAATGIVKPIVCDAGKPEGVARKAADTTTLGRLLGATVPPATPLADGLAEMVAAWRAAERAGSADRV